MINIFSASNLWLPLTQAAILILTLMLAAITYQSNQLLRRFQPDFNLLLSPPELAVRLLLVGVCFFLAWLSGLPRSQLGLTLPHPWRSLGLGLGAGVAIQILVYTITAWAIHYFGRAIYSPLVIRNILPRSPVGWVAVSLAFIPAVGMEELLFRMLWLGVFQDVLPWPLLIGLTSIIFGFMHLPQGFLGVILTGSINILFCLLFIWSGELFVPFVAHYVINLLQLIVASRQRAWLEAY